MSFSYIAFVKTQKCIYFNFEKITSSGNEFLNWLNMAEWENVKRKKFNFEKM